LSGIQGFDAEFFGIVPRAARLIDLQHRLALQVA
jgi:acyl transferase domain-containing protein